MNRTELSLSDEWETTKELYEHLCKKYNLYPNLDVAANFDNSKCTLIFDRHANALACNWLAFNNEETVVWCNPPHSKTKQFVLKAHEQWVRFDTSILMLVPLQTLGRKYLNDIFDNYITPQKGVEWHRVQPRPTFIHPDQKIPENAKQEYIVLIWRKTKTIR